jgi:tetratricopeptide (TPR) repeat protein
MVRCGSTIRRIATPFQGDRQSRPPWLGCVLASLLLAALPACSATGRLDETSPPAADSTVIGSVVSLGSSGEGDYLAGRFAQAQHDLPTAAEYLTRALAKDPENVELLQFTSLSLAASGRLADAAQVAERLLSFDGDATIAALLVAEQHAKAADWTAVESSLSGLPKRGLNGFMAPLVIAWAKVGEGKIDAALDALAPLGQSSNYTALREFHEALIDDLADRRPAAEQKYRATLASSGGLALRTVEAAASFFQRIGQAGTASEILARYRRQHPESTVADSVPAAGRPVDSAKAGLAEAFFGAAGSLRQSNVPEMSLIFGRMALDLRPDFPLAQVLVADVLEGMDRRQEANTILLGIDATSPLYWAAQLRVAANLDDMDDVDGAITTLEAMSVRRPERPDALIALGDVLRRHKRWTEAIGAYDRALKVIGGENQGAWAVYYSRGIALERSKHWARAESDFLTALSLQPDEPHVLNYLGYSWIEQGVHLDEARKMIEKAVELQPTDGFIVDSLGWAFFREGDYPKAVEALERAVELHPEDATINDHLGDALWNVGRQEEARFQWQRALTFDPEPELKSAIEHKLKVNVETTQVPGGKNAAVSP